jgi:error-prone DNA polymerase
MSSADIATYVELHAHSAFSFLDGASQPDELVCRATELGATHLALTDHDTVAGALEFAHAARAFGIVPISGAEVTVRTASGSDAHVTLLVRERAGWTNLCRLLTRAHAPRVTMPPLSADEIAATWSDVPAGRTPNQRVRQLGTPVDHHRRAVRARRRAHRAHRVRGSRAAADRRAGRRHARSMRPARPARRCVHARPRIRRAAAPGTAR